MTRGSIAALLFALGLLSGCARVDELTATGSGAPPRGYRVALAPGETLQTLSQRFNISVDDLAQANHLSPPYALQPHQVLLIPPPASYRVKSGDTVAGIATTLGVSEEELANANSLRKPYSMKIGQVLRVPGGIGGPEAPRVAQQQSNEMTVAPAPKRANIAAAPLAAPGAASAAPLPPPMPPAAAAPAAPPPAPVVPVAPPKIETASPTALAPQQAPQQVASLAAPAPPATTGAPSAQAAAVAGAPHFLVPVKGQVVSNFGSMTGGQKNDGINIAAPEGAVVQAADAGTVVYAGNELAGFGNLILVRHAGGWVTAYAHLASMSVQRGAAVTAGQTIGSVGQTGPVGSPQLHFEVRQGSKPVDPAPYLAGKL